MNIYYDRIEAGKRLKRKRKELQLSASSVAKTIDKVPNYYRDIERGTCGMSVETLIQLADCLELSMDYIIFGTVRTKGRLSQPDTAFRILNGYDIGTQKNAVKLLKTYLGMVKDGISQEYCELEPEKEDVYDEEYGS